ncbi:SIR2 family protein [Mesorhizobium sp. M0145]|uniref:SIR2 family protein n=1 Tax=Mesorhizobium sp. M0145 TaxID=2956895 RepID=UPI0033387CA9
MEIFNDLFPGNASVMQHLKETMDTGSVVAFSGAGTSMPNVPGWAELVKTLVGDALTNGRMDADTANALYNQNDDYLYVVDEIFSLVGESQTKAAVAKIFGALISPTEAHNLIVQSQFARLMTLNYDRGLEMAYASQLSRHTSSILGTQKSELDVWLRRDQPQIEPPVLHWHGLASDAQSIVLSGADYLSFYDNSPHNRETLRQIFRTWSVLMIGFGFSDPFVEREMNSVMQPLPKSNSHFAVIGIDSDQKINVVSERRKYSLKYKLEAIFYPVKASTTGHDHSALLKVLSEIQKFSPRTNDTSVAQDHASLTLLRDTTQSYRSGLFTFGDKTIYCEPNIWSGPPSQTTERKRATFQDILDADFHCTISAPHEFGLSNIGRRLVSDSELSGNRALIRDAHSFPKYRKAIQADLDNAGYSTEDHFILVLDNFSSIEHQRTVKELHAAYKNIRIILLQAVRRTEATEDDLPELGFHSFSLTGFSRSDIRTVINALSPFRNSDETSAIVDKVYNDLLQLCIPLTPSNVIMYCSVLCKDGSFSPVSRLNIVDRFVIEALQRASDAYSDTFNSINKIDLICEFCYESFISGTPTFSAMEWRSFCDKFKSVNLVSFNSTDILSDLVNGRILSHDAGRYVFRYMMFYSYFVGRHISARSELLIKCIAENRHLELAGLIEVICGMLPNCSLVLDDLTCKLEISMERFYDYYPIKGLDFHESAKWEFGNTESEIWKGVTDRFDKGPIGTQELDDLKTSLQAERRTGDQKVSIIKFIASEKTVSANVHNLVIALESAKHASASAKKAAATAVISGQVLAYEVASLFIPLIAENKYFSWNGFTYINLIEDKRTGHADEEARRERMQQLVASALPGSVAANAANVFGSRRLGQVFLALDGTAFDAKINRLILFSLIIRSKPSGWLASVKKRVGDMRRDDLYLRHMLEASMRQFQQEINTEDERLCLKELVAAVRLRREANVKLPSATEIKKVIGRLDAKGFWARIAGE